MTTDKENPKNCFGNWNRIIAEMPISCTHCRKRIEKDDILRLSISKEEFPKKPFCSIQCNIDWLIEQANQFESIAAEYKEVAKTRR